MVSKRHEQGTGTELNPRKHKTESKTKEAKQRNRGLETLNVKLCKGKWETQGLNSKTNKEVNRTR